MKIFRDIRHIIASLFVGQDVAVFIPDEQLKLPVKDMNDACLAAMTRHYFSVIEEVNKKAAHEDDTELTVFTNMHAALSLVNTCVNANASNGEFIVDAEFAGQSIGTWRVRTDYLPNGHKFPDPGLTQVVDEDGKTTKMSLTFKPKK